MNRTLIASAFCIAFFTPLLHAQTTQPQIPITYSSRESNTTPVGNIPFHGQFADDAVEATADNLPDHDFLEISFDLLILRSWDGSVPINPTTKKSRLGPDYFTLSLANGPILLYTTFSNWPDDRFTADSRFQNYPSQIPGEHLNSYEGADAKNTLGYHYAFPGPPQPVPMDSTYHIKFIIPNHDSQAIVQLAAMGLSSLDDENWGFTDIHIRPLQNKDIKTPTDDEINTAFGTALDPFATTRPAAFQTLILGMDHTADWFAKNLKPQPIDADSARHLIDNLCGDDTKINERAQAPSLLSNLGPQVEPYLRDARKSAHAEQRLRIDRVLMQIGVTPIEDEDLQKTMLATRILEIINTPRALEVRKSLTESKTP